MQALGYATDQPLADLWRLAQQEEHLNCFQSSHYKGDLSTIRHKGTGLFVRGSFSVDIHVGQGKISLYSDHSGPRLEVYVGQDWERDRGWWDTAIHVNHKLRNEPRRSLTYQGQWGADESPPRCSWYRNGTTAPFMVHTNDLDRAYSPIKGKAPIEWLWVLTTPEYRKLEPMDADAPRYMSLPAVLDYFAQQVQAVVDQIRKGGS